MTDLLKLAEENDRFHSGKDLYEAVELSNKNAAAIREAHETIEYNVKKRIEMQDELTRLHTENQQLRAENERLNGKIVSPDVTTMCYCDDCGAATRWGRHLDIDCETIKSLRDQNIIYVTAISGLHEQIRKLRAEVQRFWDIFSPDVSIEMLEEGLQARAELPKLRAELQAANEELSQLKTLHKYSCESRDLEKQICEQDNARLRKAIEGADFHPEYCATVFKEPCDCGFEQWKRNALEGK